MKALFLLNGLTHYVIPILNKLNDVENVEVLAIAASNKSTNIGSGVYVTKKGARFQVLFLDEVKRFYGKTFFKGIKTVLINEKPEIIVLGWPFILELAFNPFLLYYLKKNKIKILFKEIPFQVQSFYDALKFKATDFIDENLNLIDKKLSRKITNFFTAIIRRYYYSFIDAHINYIEDSYSLLRTFGVKKETIFISYNSPDTDTLKLARQKAKELIPVLEVNHFRLIHIGRLVKWKRVDLIIQAVADLSEIFKEIELIIIGNGPEFESLKLLSDRLGISSIVKFPGAIYDPIELARYLNSSSVYILAGMGGLSINEAMLFGKPIICSRCDGTERKLVRNGYNGYIFEDGNLESLKEKIIELLSDQEKIYKLGINSKNIIEKEVNLQTVINGYLNAFDYLLKDKYTFLNPSK
jgi:glycosyltransferase involved in cell wall biosynthesis